MLIKQRKWLNLEPLWYNGQIKINPVAIFYKEYFDKDIYYVRDLHDRKHKFMNYNTFKEIFNIKSNFPIYHGLIKFVQSYTKTSSKYNTINLINYPFLPYTTSFLYKSKKGAKDMYNIIISKNDQVPTGQVKWNKIFDLQNSNWNTIFSIPLRQQK